MKRHSQGTARALIVCAALVASTQAHAVDVLGCRLDVDPKTFNPNTIKACIEAQVAIEMSRAKEEGIRIGQTLKGAEAAQFAFERRLFDAAKEMKVNPVLECLEKEAAQGHQTANISAYVKGLSSGRPALFLQTLADDLWSRIERDFDNLFSDEMKLLQGAPPSLQGLTESAINKVRRIAQSHEGMRCLLPAADPVIRDLPSVAAGLQSSVETHARAMYSKLEPIVQQTVGKELRSVLEKIMVPVRTGTSLPTAGLSAGSLPGNLLPDDLKRIANGVIAPKILDVATLQRVAQDLSDLAAKLPDKSAALPASLRTQADINAFSRFDAIPVYVEAGMEILRFAGHQYIHSNDPPSTDNKVPGGAYIVTQAIQSLSTVKDTVGNISSALAGIVPEVGGAALSPFGEGADGAWNHLVVPAIRWAALKGLDQGFDTFVNQAKTALVSGAARAGNPGGPFAPVTDLLQREAVATLGEAYVRSTREALVSYNSGVVALATAAVK